MEGVMMRGKKSMATAVRDGDGDILVESKRITPLSQKNVFFKIPVIRGVLNFVAMLVSGTGTLLRSSEVFGEVLEPSKFDKWISAKLKIDITKLIIWFSVILGVGLAVGLFIFLPQVLTVLLFKIPAVAALPTVVFSVIEGVIRLLIFILYVLLCSLVPDVKRVFMYHGAEHKTINAFEHDEELTVENVQKYSTVHNRCGTTFMVLVMIVSIVILAFAGWLTTDVFGWPDNFGVKLAVRLVMLPLIAGISYEILKLLALSDNVVVRFIRWPGLLLQKLTTKQPDDDMVEVAIAAFNTVYAMDNDESVPEITFDIKKPFAEARSALEEILPPSEFDKSDVDWILCEVTGKGRAALAALSAVPQSAVDKAVRLAEERKTGRPLQYVLGYADFYGYKIKVDENVLIPRPETELLAEQTIKLAEGKKVLDLCTGSGAVAIATALKAKCKVYASDISSAALDKARVNAKLNGADIIFIESDLFENIEGGYDVIVSNPPYIKTSDMLTLDENVRREPALALDGGEDGLDFYRRIAEAAPLYLNGGGTLLLEVGFGQADEVKALLERGFKEIDIIPDLGGVDRIIAARI